MQVPPLRQLFVIVFNGLLCMIATYLRTIVVAVGWATGKQWPKSTQFQTPAGTLATKSLKNIRQINADGFGDPSNRYLFAMDSFQGKVYAGTSHIHHAIPGIYQFAFGTPVKTSGAQVWAFDEQQKRWDRVVANGLEHRTNFAVRKLLKVDDMLLAATVNHEKGMEVWGTLNGTTWKVLSKGGFGNANNTSGRGITQYNSKVYFTTENREQGAELWRIDTAALANALESESHPDLSGQWERVLERGLGNSSTFWFADLVVYKEQVYLGTMDNLRGFSVYRSSDGSQFTRIARNGITTRLHHAAMRLIEFRGQLFVSTMNWVSGFSLFVLKTDRDGNLSEPAMWEEVLYNGFNSGYNAYIWQMCVYNGRLYAGTFQNSFTGLRFGMFSLYSSHNGRDWIVETDNAFSGQRPAMWFLSRELGDYGIRTMLVHNEKLFIGSATAHNSCKVYVAEDSSK